VADIGSNFGHPLTSNQLRHKQTVPDGQLRRTQSNPPNVFSNNRAFSHVPCKAIDRTSKLQAIDRTSKWSATRIEGNPTQSNDVIDLLKAVKKKEVQKQGAKSMTRHPMVGKEFQNMHKILRKAGGSGKRTTTHASLWKRYGISAMVNFQFHLIARIDDSAQVIIEHIRVHDKFAHAFKARLNWSKKVQDKQDTPFQIVLGSMDPIYCILCSLALWLELNLKMYPPAMVSPYLFCFVMTIGFQTGEEAKVDDSIIPDKDVEKD
jgi:hypothetical protein